jgi:ribosome-associated translation inhibitor RaiA
MIKIDALDTQIDEKEVTAFIQQQMVDLGPHLSEKASLQVRLVKIQETFEVELTAYEEGGEVQTIGRHHDVFDAIRTAKEGLIEYFVEVENELNPQLREDKISYMSRHGSLYLH